MRIAFLLLMFLTSYNALYSQDTTSVYYSRHGGPSLPEFSDNYTKEYYSNGLWYKLHYNTADNRLTKSESALDSTFEKLDGISLGYDELDNIVWKRLYHEGKSVEAFKYYPNGKIEGHATYNKSGKINLQEGWDETGAKITPFIFEKEAEFPGGRDSWKNYLKSALNNNIPKKNGAPSGFQYNVIVSFIIDQEGNVTEVAAMLDPGYGTAEEAVRVIKNSPKWRAAIQCNKAVIYRQRQRISFLVNN